MTLKQPGRRRRIHPQRRASPQSRDPDRQAGGGSPVQASLGTSPPAGRWPGTHGRSGSAAWPRAFWRPTLRSYRPASNPRGSAPAESASRARAPGEAAPGVAAHSAGHSGGCGRRKRSAARNAAEYGKHCLPARHARRKDHAPPSLTRQARRERGRNARRPFARSRNAKPLPETLWGWPDALYPYGPAPPPDGQRASAPPGALSPAGRAHFLPPARPPPTRHRQSPEFCDRTVPKLSFPPVMVPKLRQAIRKEQR